MEQRTIKKSVELSGVGLHTGVRVNLKFKPAPTNIGINFIRVDIKDSPMVKADINSIIGQEKSPRRTSIGINGVEVHTCLLYTSPSPRDS